MGLILVGAGVRLQVASRRASSFVSGSLTVERGISTHCAAIFGLGGGMVAGGRMLTVA
jgi:hypothetical protein